MALSDNDTLTACSLHEKEGDGPSQVRLRNVRPDFQKFDLTITGQTKFETHNWSNYVLAGYKGVEEEAAKEKISLIKPGKTKIYNLFVSGNVPIGSGLSSSSALVCSTALAFSVANSLHFSKVQFADFCCKCERYIGMESGGMDQAISFLAELGNAKKIDFNPLTTQTVNLPSGVSFVISSSLVEANKYATLGSGYNMRVVECRLAAVVLSKTLGVKEWEKVRILYDVQKKTQKNLDQLIADVEQHLHKQKYSVEEISEILQLPQDKVIQQYLNVNVSSKSLFDLRERALHVFTETKRVNDFADICAKASGGTEKNVVERLGELMDQSHESCKIHYECSCNELDVLVDVCRKNGALGSRLTGAGWGGWSISLVKTEHVKEFMKQVADAMYKDQLNKGKHLDQLMVVTFPGAGAAIYKP